MNTEKPALHDTLKLHRFLSSALSNVLVHNNMLSVYNCTGGDDPRLIALVSSRVRMPADIGNNRAFEAVRSGLSAGLNAPLYEHLHTLPTTGELSVSALRQALGSSEAGPATVLVHTTTLARMPRECVDMLVQDPRVAYRGLEPGYVWVIARQPSQRVRSDWIDVSIDSSGEVVATCRVSSGVREIEAIKLKL